MTKKQRVREARDKIEDRMETCPQYLMKCILAIYDRQTDEEKARQETIQQNRVGFSAYHAAFMSEMAQWIKSGRWLTVRQEIACLKVMKYYSGQLLSMEVINEDNNQTGHTEDNKEEVQTSKAS